jgi:hypothetical protein
MFDSNAMHELAALSRDRYQRAGGGGASKVYMTGQAYHDARGYKEMSPFQRACIEMLHRFRQTASIAAEQYRLDCLTDKEGFYHGESIPF